MEEAITLVISNVSDPAALSRVSNSRNECQRIKCPAPFSKKISTHSTPPQKMQKNIIEIISTYVYGLSTQDIGSLVSAIANTVMAAGVLLAARSLRIQKNIHLIDVHNRFQSEIRRLQEKMPSDINSGRLIFSEEEKQVIKMYWYLVVDEWMTCKIKSHDRDINNLWINFSWGAKSAIDHIPIFASEFIKLKKRRPYLLGTHNKFFDEMKIIFETYENHSMNIYPVEKRQAIFLFGAPCSGKTSVSNILKIEGWRIMAIDSIVGGLINVPTKKSFSDYAEAVCLAIYGELIKYDWCRFTVIELGCLFPKEWIDHLKQMLEIISIDVIYIKLNVNINLAKQRARDRNTQISNGLSDAVLIDYPDEIESFFIELDKNTPINAINLDAEEKNAHDLAQWILQKVKNQQ